MRDAAPFVGNPGAFISSIAATEAQIEQRQHNIAQLALACRRDLQLRMTSWPVLLAAGGFGFVIARDDVRSFFTSELTANHWVPGRLRRALKIVTGLFKASQTRPW